VHVDPSHDGAEQVVDVGGRIGSDFHRRSGLPGLFNPAA
jgi:hypothetical protein